LVEVVVQVVVMARPGAKEEAVLAGYCGCNKSPSAVATKLLSWGMVVLHHQQVGVIHVVAMESVPVFWGLQRWVVEVVVGANLIHLQTPIRVVLGEAVVIGMDKEA